MPNRTQASLEEFLLALPQLDELEEYRLMLMAGAIPDPDKAWSRSGVLATVDKRVIGPEVAERALDEAERSLTAYVQELFVNMRPVLQAYWAGDPAEAAQRLIELGEMQERKGRFRAARRTFEAALTLSLPLQDKAAQIVALRRIGRIARAIGDLNDALQFYRRSAALARDVDDDRNRVIAMTGSGNVLAMQGRFAEAEECYLSALELTGWAVGEGALQLEQGQLFNNLGMALTRLNRMEEAEAWFHRAMGVWGVIDSPTDAAICYHNFGVLRQRGGRSEEARELFGRAMELTASPVLRAAVAVDMAESCMQSGRVAEAEQWGREAENHAIASRSPYSIGHMYLGLGKIARARGDADGIVFFEKALQIAREREYSLLEGEVLVEYALLRMDTDGGDEARAYLERAVEVLAPLGDIGELNRVRSLLGGVTASSTAEPPESR